MDTFDFGEFGELTLEDAKKSMMLERDYRRKTTELNERQRSLDAMTQQAQEAQYVIDLIDKLGVGEQVVDLINQAANPQRGPQYGREDYNPDPYVYEMEDRLNQALQKIEQLEGGFYNRWVQDDLREFRHSHPDLTDEDVDYIGQFMMQENLPSLDYAYKLSKYDESMQAAREDGEGRVRQQLETGRLAEGILSPPLLGYGQGGPSEQPPEKPMSWKQATQAALADLYEGEQEP